MAGIYYDTIKGTAAARPIYGVAPTNDLDVPDHISVMTISGAPDAIVWPVPSGESAGREAWSAIDTTGQTPVLVVDPDADIPDYREKRKAAYIAGPNRLGADDGNVINTIGDVHDALIKKMRVLESAIMALDADAVVASADFDSMVVKIDAIKNTFPKV